MLNVRIAHAAAAGARRAARHVSGYIFSLKPGDNVTVSGPFGEFFARDTQAEMVFIGGGAGMAPHALAHLRSVQARAHRPQDELLVRRAQQARAVLRRGLRSPGRRSTRTSTGTSRCRSRGPRTTWHGLHRLHPPGAARSLSEEHPAPEDCEYYLCGPPMMNSAVQKMLDDLGVERGNILFDDFGG